MSTPGAAWPEIWNAVRAVGIALVAALLVRQFVAETFPVNGPSMEPTFHTGEGVLVFRAAYLFGPLRPGQVMGFKPPVPSMEWGEGARAGWNLAFRPCRYRHDLVPA